MARVRFDLRENKKSSSEDESFTNIEETPKDQWDCESILSKDQGWAVNHVFHN